MPVRDLTQPVTRQFEALQRLELARAEREARMLNALEILIESGGRQWESDGTYARFVRATAREGLGRET